MKLVESILTQNPCYTAGRKITVKGLMLHSVGCPQPSASVFVRNWNKASYDRACVHAFIDGNDGTIYQTLPWNHRGWHAGTGTSGGSANNTHISFEICEDDLADPAYFKKVYREAVELTALLCKEYGLNPLADGVVICHSEGYRRGIASGHADVEHWFPRHGKSMDDFRRDVAAALAPKPEPDPDPKPDPEEDDEMTYYKTLDEVPEYYRPTVEKLVEAGALRGTAENVLNVSEDFCRTMTVLDRLGRLD